MKSADAIVWFDELACWKEGGGNEISEWVAWVTESSTAIASVFPVGHPVRSQWEATIGDGNIERISGHPLTSARGIILAARQILKSGRLPSLLEGVRAQTVGELLDQAEELLGADHTLAATVIAGGALETHLRHLCDRAGCLPSGSGSIERYKAALDIERKKGREVIRATESKLVTAWGGRRNDAAHDPSKFSANAAEVQTMIDGIRQLVVRTSSP